MRRWCLLGALGLLLGAAAVPDTEPDHRAWQHGVNLLRVEGRWLAVWASAGNPPKPTLGQDWQHDVYYAWLDPVAALEPGEVLPHTLVARPEAQEPPSVAINARGTILLTAEDGEDGINQRAGLWNSRLEARRPYPFTIRRGGHSGHAAALGDEFLVAYGEGWIRPGGYHDWGTGENIFARIVRDDGRVGPEIRLATRHRDSWPLVAASHESWLVVWQRYPQLTLQSALVDAQGRVVARRQIIDKLPLRYAYDVKYASAVESYVIVGSTAGKGFIALVGLDGRLQHLQAELPPIASESEIALQPDGDAVLGVYPVRPHGVAVVRISRGDVQLLKLIPHPYAWDYAGTAVAFVGPRQVLLATLSETGLRTILVGL